MIQIRIKTSCAAVLTHLLFVVGVLQAGTLTVTTDPAYQTVNNEKIVTICEDQTVTFSCSASTSNGTVDPNGYNWKFQNGTIISGNASTAGPIMVTFGAAAPLGNRNNMLQAKSSCAVNGKDRRIPNTAQLKLLSQDISTTFGNTDWDVADTGGGLKPLQIDLYWGEDDPRGTKGGRFRAKGTDFTRADNVPVILKNY